MSFPTGAGRSMASLIPASSCRSCRPNATSRKIQQPAAAPKSVRSSAVWIARKRQKPKQNVFTKLVHALPSRRFNRIANGLKTVSRSDTIKQVEVNIGADDIYVREFRMSYRRILVTSGVRRQRLELAI